MVYTFEVIGLFFAIVMVYFSFLSYKRKEISKLGFIFWEFFWIAGVSLIIFHNYANKILDPLNIMRVLDLYMIISFMFLFALIFYLFKIIKRTEKRVEDLTRTLALKSIDKEKK